MSGSYYKSLQKALRKHRKEYEYVYTTMGDWSTAVSFSIVSFFKRIGFVRRLYIQVNYIRSTLTGERGTR
jgi:hypothetical protein